jgi:hypothetical protein
VVTLKRPKSSLFSPSEDDDDVPKPPKKVRKQRAPTEEPEEEHPSSPEADIGAGSLDAVEVPPGKRRKGKGSSAVSAKDQIPQPVAKHGYPKEAYLLNSRIFLGVSSIPLSFAFDDSDFARRQRCT